MACEMCRTSGCDGGLDCPAEQIPGWGRSSTSAIRTAIAPPPNGQAAQAPPATCPSSNWRASSLTRRFASAAIVIWTLSLPAPALFGCVGTGLAVKTLLGGWLILWQGPWAALANFTVPWTCMCVLLNVRPRLPAWLTVVFPSTSAAFWHALGSATTKEWGVYLWTVAIVLTAMAALVGARSDARAPQ